MKKLIEKLKSLFKSKEVPFCCKDQKKTKVKAVGKKVKGLKAKKKAKK